MTSPDKAMLRTRLIRRRATLADADPNAGQRLADRFPVKLFERFGPIVSAYLPIGSEIDPTPLIMKLAGHGAQLALPRLNESGEMAFHSWAPGAPLQKGPFGLQQPLAETPRVRPGLVLAPLLGFDARGTRLGYGKGFYDRTLSKLRDSGRVFICGLAFADQECVVLPAESHDAALDWVITETGSLPLFLGRAAQ